MDINKIISELKDCPCGRNHTADIKAVEIGHGLKEKTAEILRENGFPTDILVVADRNTLQASDGILDILRAGGFRCVLKLYENLREPLVERVHEIEALCRDKDGILSVGTGSLNDICRRAALTEDKEFAIFATAPSMDGFASGTSPIIENNIKTTLPARQPGIIIGDTGLLAASPALLKAAGFGDIIGKYIALTDWRISNTLTGEYYCEKIADLVRSALKKVVSMADRVTQNDEETAKALMETLVLTGLAMRLADSSRPASGAEHMISHFWGMKKLEDGKSADYHGKKVGVAALALTGIYRRCAGLTEISFHEDNPDWEKVYFSYGTKFIDYIKHMNSVSATAGISPQKLSAAWPQICRIINEELPEYGELFNTMKRAGAAVSISEIDIDWDLAISGLLYHPFMRHKVTLTRLFYMTDVNIAGLTDI